MEALRQTGARNLAARARMTGVVDGNHSSTTHTTGSERSTRGGGDSYIDLDNYEDLDSESVIVIDDESERRQMRARNEAGSLSEGSDSGMSDTTDIDDSGMGNDSVKTYDSGNSSASSRQSTTGSVSLGHGSSSDSDRSTDNVSARMSINSKEFGGKDVKDWPIIMHKTIAVSTIGAIIRSKCDKVRTSESLQEDTLVFPNAKLAFLIVNLTDAVMYSLKDMARVMTIGRLKTGLTVRIDNFIAKHANSYVVLIAGLFTDKAMEAIGILQRRYLNSQMQDFLLAHNAEEAVHTMMTVSSMQMPPTSFHLTEQFCEVMNELVYGSKHPQKLTSCNK